jgi:hypothetical protein
MARRSILSSAEREMLYACPHDDSILQFHTLSESDIAIIKQRRGAENRLGFAVQLCYLRYPGVILGTKEKASLEIVDFVAEQLQISPSKWELYGSRQNTIHEHLRELQILFGFKSFTMEIYGESLVFLDSLAMQTDKGIFLAATLVEHLRSKLILLPSVNVIERLCSEAITKANRQIYQKLTE